MQSQQENQKHKTNHKNKKANPTNKQKNPQQKTSNKQKQQTKQKQNNQKNTKKWDRYQQWRFMHDDILCVMMMFFFLEFGRCRAKARSLHEYKLSKRRLYKDTVGPYNQANRRKKQQTKNTQNHQTTTTRKSPSQTCVSPEKTAKQTTANQTHKNGAGAQTKHPQIRFAKGYSGLTTASLSKTCERMN